MKFTDTDVAAISAVLGKADQIAPSSWLWNLRSADGRVLALSVTCNVPVLEDASDSIEGGLPVSASGQTIVTAQTHQGYIELHNVNAYLSIEPDEIMFVSKSHQRFSGMVVGSTCTCSQFANISTSLLKSDFSIIDPALLMAAMQLSLAESVIEDSAL